MTARSGTLLAASRSGYRAAAPAKLNLYLHVVGKREDGYHLLDSLVAFADVHDTVTAVGSDRLSLKLDGPFGAALTAEPDNLVLRAARRLAELGGVEPRARLRLIKRLPVASGIGGGSADAAAALRVLAALWKLEPAAGDLNKLAMGLGADVPVCLGGRAVYMGGIGEKLAPAPALPPAGLVLVNPGVPLSTPPVFKARTGPFSEPARFTQAPRDARALAKLLEARRNDLARPAIALLPAIDRVLAALARSGGCLIARMSGSGATCFGLYADRAAAAQAGRAIGEAEPGWWVAAGNLVGDISKVQPSV
ncbi:MAG: 4-(cytidine 5'-diphospho)-2-C-methyl-D-erythritol kinase [Alphaproteobacteria bacterium]|nr:4-(cytidine 5'-diphospho)-2-C-methyl-D-erythritol kinase [Alphaproteobacteria bacterium]